MKKFSIDDLLWKSKLDFLPTRLRRFQHTGSKPLDDRRKLAGILCVLWKGISWKRLPKEKGYGSGMSCLRQLRKWQREGAWPEIQKHLMAQLEDADKIEWWRANADGSKARIVLWKRARKKTRRMSKRLGKLRLVSS